MQSAFSFEACSNKNAGACELRRSIHCPLLRAKELEVLFKESWIRKQCDVACVGSLLGRSIKQQSICGILNCPRNTHR